MRGGVGAHLQGRCVLRYLAALLVVVERVEEDEVEVFEDVERVLVLVLSERVLDAIDATRLGYDLGTRGKDE